MNNELTDSRSPSGFRTAVGLALPLAILAWVGFQVDEVAPVQAQATGVSDADGDGLHDKLESVLGTSPFDADTDGDGFSDLEEFARHSGARDRTIEPRNHEVSVALSARGGGGNYLTAAIYSRNGVFTNKSVAFGGVLGGRLGWFPLRQVLDDSTLRIYPSRDGARIAVIEWRISPHLVRRFGYVSFFAAAGFTGGQTRFYSAAVADLEHVDGVNMFARGDYAYAGATQALMSQVGGGGTGTGSGGFGTPIPPSDGGLPDDWTSGAACVQQASTVGASGAVLTQEITEANCEDGWDSACAGSCSSSVGSTFQTVDPVTIVGG